MDNEVVNKDLSVIIWILLNNIDPKRDCVVTHIKKCAVMFIDGRRKTKKSDNFSRDWPNIIVSDNETIKIVDEKWEKYNLGEFIPSPSIKFRELLFGDEAQADD